MKWLNKKSYSRMKMLKIFGFLWVLNWILATVVLLCFKAHAQSGAPAANNQIRVHEDGKTVIYKKRSLVEFDDKLIEGDVKNPSEFYFVHRPEEKFGSLIKKRKNFHKEMLRDAVMIR